MSVPLLDLTPQYQALKEEIKEAMNEVCDSQRFILGPVVKKLEEEVAEYCETDYSCGVTSGSDGLIIALMAEDIKAGDEVITTPFTFFATVGAIARVGATPIFVDIDPKTFNMDPALLEAAITPKTKAIIPIHLFGQCADMDPIMEIAKKHNLIVIEDACQAIGSTYKNRKAGSFGDYGVFSFFPSKNLGCFGDGGIVTTNDKEKYELLKVFRNHGQSGTYIHKYIGGNFRLDALQAAILSVKLRYLDGWSTQRKKNAAEYLELFAEKDIKGVTMPFTADYTTSHIYNQFSILVDGDRRDALRAHLNSKNIGCSVYYPISLHLQECFSYLGGKEGDFPISERISKEIISLPIYPESTYEDRQIVVNAIADFLK